MPSTTIPVVILAVVLCFTIMDGARRTNSYFVSLEGLEVTSETQTTGNKSSSAIEDDLANRISYLETKLNTYLAFTSDP